jgi:hypothetical protein
VNDEDLERYLLTLTVFFPCHVRAFIISPLGSAYFALSLAGFVTSCSVTALSPWPRIFSTPAAACDNAIFKVILRVICVVREDSYEI